MFYFNSLYKFDFVLFFYNNKKEIETAWITALFRLNKQKQTNKKCSVFPAKKILLVIIDPFGLKKSLQHYYSNCYNFQLLPIKIVLDVANFASSIKDKQNLVLSYLVRVVSIHSNILGLITQYISSHQQFWTPFLNNCVSKYKNE